MSVLLISAALALSSRDPVTLAVDAHGVPRLTNDMGPSAAADMRRHCIETRSLDCRMDRRSAAEPMAARDDLVRAISRHCAEAGGSFNVPADVERFSSMLPVPLGSYRAVVVTSTDYTCRLQSAISGARITTYDFGAFSDKGRGNVLSRMLAGRRSSYEALTGVFVVPASRFAQLEDDRARRLAVGRYNLNRLLIVEGQRVCAGLVVERRGRVALVQPETAPARWMLVDDLADEKACGDK